MKLAERLRPDQFEAYWSRNRVVTVRVALNEIVEAKSMAFEGASTRIVINKSVGFASTTDLSDRGLERMVEKAYKAARAKSPDAEFQSLPEPEKTYIPAEYDKALGNIDPSKAVELALEGVNILSAEEPGLDLSGSVNIVNEECCIKNSLGVDVSDLSAFIFSSFTLEDGEKRSAMAQSCSRKLSGFDIQNAMMEALVGIRGCKESRSVEPGKYDVIFSPQALAELAEYVLAYGLDLSAVDSGISYLRGMLGEAVANDKLTLLDDGRHPVGIASKAVDDEGVPTRTTTLIDRGVLRCFLSDTYYANKLSSNVREFRSTGNGFRFGPVPGRNYSALPQIQPTNLVVKTGEERLEEMVKDTARGILLGRIWYSYPVNPTVGEFSTTNRGDTFYIEKGDIAGYVPPNSFRINDSLPRLLKEIQGIGREQKQSIVWGGVSSCLSPYVKFRDVKITYSRG
jgi:PmbA protein